MLKVKHISYNVRRFLLLTFMLWWQLRIGQMTSTLDQTEPITNYKPNPDLTLTVTLNPTITLYLNVNLTPTLSCTLLLTPTPDHIPNSKLKAKLAFKWSLNSLFFIKSSFKQFFLDRLLLEQMLPNHFLPVWSQIEGH